MKILLTNDDGPPSESSPFLIPFLKSIPDDWQVKIVLPDTQKSWISKGISTQQVDIRQIDMNGYQMTLLNCTPASCVNIALSHFNEDFDLVISGPNYGRNAGSSSCLSSGTMGGALEACLLGKPSISVSFGYHSKEDCLDMKRVNHACEAAVKSLSKLVKLFSNDSPHMFNVNIPLITEIGDTVFTRFYHGGYSSLYQKLGDSFTFGPQFDSIPTPGTDLWALYNGMISITPMMASYHVEDHHFDLEKIYKVLEDEDAE